MLHKNKFTSFCKRYKLSNDFALVKKFKKTSVLFSSFFCFGYINITKGHNKKLLFFVLKNYYSNFIKQLIYRYIIIKKKNNNKLLKPLKKVFLSLYILKSFKELFKKIKRLKHVYNFNYHILIKKNTIYFSSLSDMVLKKKIIAALELCEFGKSLSLKKNSIYKNLLIFLDKRRIIKDRYSRSVNWLTKYSEIQIFYFFENLYLKISQSFFFFKLLELSYIKRLLENSFLLTLAKKKKSSQYLCKVYFKFFFLLLKKKKNIILFEKC